MLELGNGKNTYYIVAEGVNMGISLIDIKLTDNEAWAKANTIICTIEADSLQDARELFRVRDLTR